MLSLGDQLDRILDEAIRAGDMETAIGLYGQGVSRADLDVLRSLSAGELHELTELRGGAAPMGTASGAVF